MKKPVSSSPWANIGTRRSSVRGIAARRCSCRISLRQISSISGSEPVRAQNFTRTSRPSGARARLISGRPPATFAATSTASSSSYPSKNGRFLLRGSFVISRGARYRCPGESVKKNHPPSGSGLPQSRVGSVALLFALVCLWARTCRMDQPRVAASCNIFKHVQAPLTELLKPDGCRAPPSSSHRAAGARHHQRLARASGEQ